MPHTPPNENCPDDNIEEAPLAAAAAAASLRPPAASSSSATLPGVAGLEVIDDDDGPDLQWRWNMRREIIGGAPSAAYRGNAVDPLPRTPPPVKGIDRIDDDDDDDGDGGDGDGGDDGGGGLELPPSIMHAAALEMEEAGGYSKKKGAAAASTDDDDEDDIGENVKGGIDKIVDAVDDDDKRNAEASTQDKTIDCGDDTIRAYGGMTGFPSGPTRNVTDNWEIHPGLTRISTADRTLPGAFHVPGMLPDHEAEVNGSSSSSETSAPSPLDGQITVADAFLVDEREREVVFVAMDVQAYRPWWKERRTQLLLGTVCVLAATLAISTGITLGTSNPDEQKLPSQENTPSVVPALPPWLTFAPTVENCTSCIRDWAPCWSSFECETGCCSGTYSGGKLVCTTLDEVTILGGYLPNICVGDPATPWAQCLSSSECDSGCCSGHYTGGRLKCVPIAVEENCMAYGIEDAASEVTPTPTVACTSTSCLNDWAECSSSFHCENGCCSGNFTGEVLRCTPHWLTGFAPDMCTAV